MRKTVMSVGKNPRRVLSISHDSRRRAKPVVACALVSTLALLACSNRNFNTPQLLDVPRVLAIQAEPPQPRVGQATTLQALVYLPPGDLGENATYHWSWCPLPTSSNSNYKCPIDQAGFDQIAASIGFGTAPSLDLGTGKTATLVNPFPAEILAKLCTASISDLLGTADAGTKAATDAGWTQAEQDCLNIGFPITIYLSVEPTSTGKLDAVFLVKLPTDDSIPGNQNPIIGGIQANWKGARDGGAPAKDTQTYDAAPTGIDANEPALDAGEAIDSGETPMDAEEPLDVGDTPPAPDAAIVIAIPVKDSDGVLLDQAFSTLLPRQQRIQLHAQLPMESSEDLTAAQIAAATASQIKGNPDYKPRSSELLNLAWFAEAGDFGDDGEGGHRTGFQGRPEDIDSLFSGATDNKWTLPKSEDYKGSTSRLIVVVRDSRGGVAWTTGSASLEPTP
jgi:hypothetical protein